MRISDNTTCIIGAQRSTGPSFAPSAAYKQPAKTSTGTSITVQGHAPTTGNSAAGTKIGAAIGATLAAPVAAQAAPQAECAAPSSTPVDSYTPSECGGPSNSNSAHQCQGNSADRCDISPIGAMVGALLGLMMASGGQGNQFLGQILQACSQGAMAMSQGMNGGGQGYSNGYDGYSNGNNYDGRYNGYNNYDNGYDGYQGYNNDNGYNNSCEPDTDGADGQIDTTGWNHEGGFICSPSKAGFATDINGRPSQQPSSNAPKMESIAAFLGMG